MMIRSYYKKNKKYILWLKFRSCIVCGKDSEPHHVRQLAYIPYKYAGGTGSKPSDLMCIPLCREHHEDIERSPEQFSKEYHIDIQKEIILCLAEYIVWLNKECQI